MSAEGAPRPPLPCDSSHLCGHHRLFFTPLALFVPAFLILLVLLSFFLLYLFRENLHNLFGRYVWRGTAPAPTPTPSLKVNQELDPTILESFPVFLYEKAGKGKVGPDCTVCLLEFEEGSGVRLLTVCCHAFHRACIDRWLSEHATCPVCRSDLTAPPDAAAVVAANEVLDSHVVTIKQRTNTVESLLGWMEAKPLQSNENAREHT